MTAALPLGTVPLEHPRRLALEPPMRARVVQLLEEGAAGIPSVGDLRGAQTVLEGGEGGVLGRLPPTGCLLAVTFAAPVLPDPDDRGWEEEEAMMLDEKMTRRYLGRAGRRTDSPILASRANTS